MEEVYETACEYTKAFNADDECMKMLAKDFNDAVDTEFQKLAFTDAVKERIYAAARVGAEQIELCRFYGSEVSDTGFALLSLFKGSKTKEFNEMMRTEYGFESLLEKLKKEYRPFRVHHHWNTRTTQNKVILSWKQPDVEESVASNVVV